MKSMKKTQQSVKSSRENPNSKLSPELLEKARLMWFDGAASPAIAAEIGSCEQNIRYHIKKWQRIRDGKAEPPPPSRPESTDPVTIFWIAVCRKRLGAKVTDARKLVDFLRKIELGMQPQAAAEALGWTTELTKFKHRYPKLPVIILMAVQRFHEEVLRGIRLSGRNDSRVGMWLLERNRVTREDYKESAKELVVKVENTYERGRADLTLPVIEAEILKIASADDDNQENLSAAA